MKSLIWIFALVVIFVAGQAVSELSLPEYMSDIINNGIYEDYEPLYIYEEMATPSGFTIEEESAATGYDVNKMPVFYMKDGFSTIDIKAAYEEAFEDQVDFEFQDIKVSDSKVLFEDVLMPFINSLKPFQGKTYSELSLQEKTDYKNALSKLIVVDTIPDSGSNAAVNLDTFLELESDTDDASQQQGGLWNNETVRKLLASCFACMKHSIYGNVMPIPIDENNARIETDEYGQALELDKVQYVIDEDTERYAVMYDYEIILCHRVFGYAYKYVDGAKWIKHKLGTSYQHAKQQADRYNIEHDIDTSEKSWFSKLIDNLSFVKTERQVERDRQNGIYTEPMTAEDMLLPDGSTTQTSDFSYILKKGGMMLLFAFLAFLTGGIAAFTSAEVVARFSSIVRKQVFDKVETFSSREFDQFSTASLITRSTNDINQIQNIFLLILRTALGAPITIIGGLILSLNISVDMTLVILYPLPFLFIGAAIAAKIVFPIFDVIQTKVDRLTLIMRENLTGIRVVRAFNRQGNEAERFREVNDSLTKSAITVNRWTALMAPAVTVAMNITGLGIIYVAARLIADGNTDMNIGDMLAIQQYIALTMTALVMLAVVLVMYPRAATSAKRINEILDTKLTLFDAQDAKDNSTEVGKVEFNNVNFKYEDNAEQYILKNINFVAEKGKTTAIVGGTGSGKSTLIGLIPRLYDVTDGEVKVGGQDVKTMPQEALRYKIGYVPQKSMLFSGTIADNLRFGKKDATEKELWDALRIAQSEDFVKNKEGMLEHIVEQGGGNFSGGQKQRLSIARAIVRRPEIYIFDDSFSALDFLTDKNLRTALKDITKDSAVIIVAQRIGTIIDADNIIVLDNGEIVGEGKHEYLLHNCDVYRDIALSQMSKEELGL